MRNRRKKEKMRKKEKNNRRKKRTKREGKREKKKKNNWLVNVKHGTYVLHFCFAFRRCMSSPPRRTANQPPVDRTQSALFLPYRTVIFHFSRTIGHACVCLSCLLYLKDFNSGGILVIFVVHIYLAVDLVPSGVYWFQEELHCAKIPWPWLHGRPYFLYLSKKRRKKKEGKEEQRTKKKNNKKKKKLMEERRKTKGTKKEEKKDKKNTENRKQNKKGKYNKNRRKKRKQTGKKERKKWITPLRSCNPRKKVTDST